MKNLSIILVVFILFSCGEANKKEHNSVSTSENKTLETAKTEIKKTNNNKVLCKINGKDWEYTTSDGMVSRNSSTQVRTATIGFKKQLEKGYESIQLEYDVDKNVLNNVWVQLKRPTKDGKMITAFYTQYGDKIDQDPKASLSGTHFTQNGNVAALSSHSNKIGASSKRKSAAKKKLGNAALAAKWKRSMMKGGLKKSREHITSAARHSISEILL